MQCRRLASLSYLPTYALFYITSLYTYTVIMNSCLSVAEIVVW